jgi:hypothetical protein
MHAVFDRTVGRMISRRKRSALRWNCGWVMNSDAAGDEYEGQEDPREFAMGMDDGPMSAMRSSRRRIASNPRHPIIGIWMSSTVMQRDEVWATKRRYVPNKCSWRSAT